MTTIVCIPVHRIKCKVHVDQGRAWTAVEELVLAAIAQQPASIAELSHTSRLPHQIIAYAIARLMRFRFAAVQVAAGGEARFTASSFGGAVIESGDPLPFFPKRAARYIHIVVERVTGQVFSVRDLRLIRKRNLEELQKKDRRTLVLDVTGAELSAGHDAMFERLAAFVERGQEEMLAFVEASTVSIWSNTEYMGVAVEDGICLDLPVGACGDLRDAVLAAATDSSGRRRISIPYAGREAGDPVRPAISCRFSSEDIVIGGSAQKQLLTELISQANRRVIIHSTFIGKDCVEELFSIVQQACARGVLIDLLWGAAHGEESKERYARTATELVDLVRADRLLCGRLRIGLQSTGSHSKILLTDTQDGAWRAVLSSCNWLKSPFQSVEISAVLRHPHIVAQVASTLQKLTGTRGLNDPLASEMALLARDLLKQRGEAGPANLALVTGEDHDRLMRQASANAGKRLFIGMHKLGSTARPGALIPSEFAARAKSGPVQVLYTQPAGPLKNRHAREYTAEAASDWVQLIHAKVRPLHGKILVWGEDDAVITSLNWGSASVDRAFPLGEIGIHVHSSGIATDLYDRLTRIFPELLPRREMAS